MLVHQTSVERKLSCILFSRKNIEMRVKIYLIKLLTSRFKFTIRMCVCSFVECIDGEGRTRPEELFLVLRRWCKLIPSSEFRCIVKDKKLIGK